MMWLGTFFDITCLMAIRAKCASANATLLAHFPVSSITFQAPRRFLLSLKDRVCRSFCAKYFATRSAFEDKLVERQNPLMINIDRDNEAQPSDGGMVFVKTTHHVHWLACDVPQSQEETSPYRDLQVIWWPSLLPQSGLGSISFKFNYVHVRNGERQHANLPIAPVVARDYHFTDCLCWRVTTPSTPEQPALVLRFTMLA
jgi:hypothetical protein